MSLKTRGDAPMPREYHEWILVKKTGWTLDYVRSMSVQDYNNCLQIIDAEAKAGI